jgi:glyoxylase-like metal-dependent hydrolase (beta-lactamase superfamily II)
MTMTAQPAEEVTVALTGLTVLERGWLSSNNILIHPAPHEPGVVMVDTGHVNHANQTVALVARALESLGGVPLAAIVNTHLHSDHCGGNASLQAAYGAPIWVAPGMRVPVQDWDPQRLTYQATGQRIARFPANNELSTNRPLRAGGRDWEVIPAPGHDPDSVMLFDRERGVLISADALWENGFGVVFPEVTGEPGFDDVGAVLDVIEALPVRVVIPGHGRPFTDVASALARARSRLAGFRAEPARHARHAAKVLIKYHVMEVREESWDDLLRWGSETPLMAELWHRPPQEKRPSPSDWCRKLVDEMISSQVLKGGDGRVSDVAPI